MFDSALEQIQALRGNKKINIDLHNGNRYRLLLNEEDGSQTSYFFSTPIYQIHNGRLVKKAFTRDGSLLRAEGSNAQITVDGQKITLRNEDGCADLFVSGKAAILPTFNGVAVKGRGAEANDLTLRIHTDRPFAQTRSNTKYFAIMIEDFKPFLLASGIGMWNEEGTYLGPAKMTGQTIDERNFLIILSASKPAGLYQLEVNCYEPKIMEDTTVESKNSYENNLYGGMGWIGESTPFGLQWLYSKMDVGKMQEILDQRIKKVVLHVPKYNSNNLLLQGHALMARFCSLGSTWDNKTESTGMISEVSASVGYYSFDLTNQIRDPATGFFTNMNGLVLRPAVKNGDFAAIATGDNYFTPQIIEVQSTKLG